MRNTLPGFRALNRDATLPLLYGASISGLSNSFGAASKSGIDRDYRDCYFEVIGKVRGDAPATRRDG
jgi:hypothetical protein